MLTNRLSPAFVVVLAVVAEGARADDLPKMHGFVLQKADQPAPEIVRNKSKTEVVVTGAGRSWVCVSWRLLSLSLITLLFFGFTFHFDDSTPATSPGFPNRHPAPADARRSGTGI